MILVVGKTGQVAREIRRSLPDAVAMSRAAADLSQPEAAAAALGRAIDAHGADAVINAAAYTAVDKAEEESDVAHAVNGIAPGLLAAECARRDIPFVQISTDYIFDGTGQEPWAPDAPTGPLGVYGATKLAGERAVVDAGGRHAILRTSWVFSAHGSNFVKTMLRLSDTRPALSIVADQIGGPTPAAAIAQACVAIAEHLKADPGLAGVYHFSGQPDVSWAGFARAILAVAGRDVPVTEIATSDYPTPATRPLNSCLHCGATEAAFGLLRPDWRVALPGILDEISKGHV